jgi:hypothetical protein
MSQKCPVRFGGRVFSREKRERLGEALTRALSFVLMSRVFQDDLPVSERPSRLRALGAISAASTSIEIAFGEREDALKRTVGVAHVRFGWNGGSWAFFICPTCFFLACRLKLHDGRVQCRACLLRAGVPYRIANGSGAEKAAARRARIDKLSERLFGGSHARLKPRRAGTIERRRRLEVSLRRALVVERQKRLKGAHNALDEGS